MTKELEIEFKNLLTQEEYMKLLSVFGYRPEDAHTQINHYFDTADFRLRNQRSALRIRQKGEMFECTLKTPAENGYYEITDALEAHQAEEILKNRSFPAPEVEEALQELGMKADLLEPLGSLATHRIEFPYQSGLLVLDHSEYLGKEDFEIEYEVTDFEEGKQRFQAFLNEHEIPVRNTDKKIARFMDSAKNR
ncbi:CYTH domain-containing protein [Planococcus salinarum]|uniref:CYTH domain-containing protein n=1 Tax=Planococcus salinarum TaxID=622695 RepID=UPI000E3D004F|nr:CYTH domain-containing protein [Planococcus salinarum]TAA73162.1 CYTH domain-containing protein [Planococcus salinarum]